MNIPASSADASSKSRQLTAENLARDFGIRSALTKDALAQLYAAIAHREEAYSRWESVFRQLWGSVENRLLGPLEKLKQKIGVRDIRGHHGPTQFLFALQTYYALLLNLLVKRFEHLRRHELIDPVFAWSLDSACPETRSAVQRIAGEMEHYRICPLSAPQQNAGSPDPAQRFFGGSDLLKILHHSLFPRAIRHPLGEYYTPDWLAEHLLDQLAFDGLEPGRLLDPACGCGTFLMAAIRRIRRGSLQKSPLPSPPLPREDAKKNQLLAQILKSVVGIDLNPLAVMAAKANYLIAIHDLLPNDEPLEIPVHGGDSILGLELFSDPQFDFVLGNPPWIAWDNLPGDYRAATKPLWEKYGLFSLSANAARHGGGKKDLSMLMLYVAADRHLKHGGRLGFVITQTLFQTKGAGDGFRRFCLGRDDADEKNCLRVLRVDDLTAIKPFDDAANWTSTIVLEKGAPTIYPVPYLRWESMPIAPAVGQISDPSTVGQICNLSPVEQTANLPDHKIPCRASPIDPRRPTSPWHIQPEDEVESPTPLTAAAPSDYRAHLGANSGGANGVYWVEVLGEADRGVRIRNLVEKCKKPVEAVEAVIEPDLLYPLLRWSDLSRFAPLPRYCLLMVQDFERRIGLDDSFLKRQFPLTYDYLRRFESLLASRAAYRRYQATQPFYSMYNVGPYTVADYKVVWRRMDKRLNAAVVETLHHPLLGRRPVVPQETCTLVACHSAEESHYLSAMLNSEPADRLIRSHSVRGGKGFGTPSILDYLPIRQYDPANPLHQELASCSREAHDLAKAKKSHEMPQEQIDRLAISAFSER